MVTILERREIALIRDRSSFIGILLHVKDVNEVKNYLSQIKKEYPKAKHYCYAYSIHGQKKCSDDGEPAKAAGRPLMNLLEKKDLNEILLVVVRYFGGVLLGASRLMSTYLETGVQVVDSADLVEIKNVYVYRLELTYSQFDELKHLSKLEAFSLENVSYNDTIKVDVLAPEEMSSKLVDLFPHANLEVVGTKTIYQRQEG